MTMQFDDLGTVWRSGEGPPRDVAHDLERARARAAIIERAVRRRDALETLVALALAPLFAWFALTTASTLTAVGAWIVVLACVFVPIRLRLARGRPPDRGASVAQAVDAELAAIRAQQRLLGSVAWWYLTPLGVGVILFFAGAPVPAAVKIAYAAIVVALYAWILRLNQRAVRRDLEPAAQALERWRQSFTEGSSNGVSDG